jgi:nucleotide-binding universal stress UspA family protein
MRPKSKAASTPFELKRSETSRRRANGGLQLQRILVPVDFSKGSAHALRYGERVAKAFGGQITILNVIPLNEGLLRLGANQLKLLDEQMQENQRRHLVSFVRSSGVAAPSDCMVRIGNPTEEIFAAARDMEAGLIVIATRGLTGMKRALLGSTAEAVVRRARCAVWIVPIARQKKTRIKQKTCSHESCPAGRVAI